MTKTTQMLAGVAWFAMALLTTGCSTDERPVSTGASPTTTEVVEASDQSDATQHTPGDDDVPSEVTQAEVDEARALWESRAIVSYTWRVSRACMCSAPLEVVVRDGAVESFIILDPDAGLTEDELRGDAVTVDELFDKIDGVLAAGRQVRALFDAVDGYPSVVESDGPMPETGLFVTTEDFTPSR